MSQPTREVFWPTTRNDIHWVIWSGTAVAALITLSSAAAGALSPGSSPIWGLLVAVGAMSPNLVTWWWSLSGGSSDSARGEIARGSVAICPALILGVILAGTSTAALLGVLAIVAVGLAFVVVMSQRRNVALDVPNLIPVAEPAIQISESTALPPETPAAADAFDDPSVNQQIIRRRTDSGHDTLEALLRLEFAADQREVSIHIPIQPALPGLPQVDCEPLDDADISLRVAATHPYGIRIDAKRAGNLDEPATIPVGILIHSVGEAEVAA